MAPTSMRIDRSKSLPAKLHGNPFRVATDPRPVDAACVCGCGRTRSYIAVKHEDPFASTECCRAYYGVCV
jgi:hypothetical protein